MTSEPPSGGGDQQGRPADGVPPQTYGFPAYPPPSPEQYGARPYGTPEYGGPDPSTAGHPAYPPPAGYPAYPQPGHPGGSLDPDDPLVASSFRGWLAKSFGVLARSWKSLLLIQLAIYVPGFVLGAVIGGAAALGLPLGLVAVLGLLLFVAVVAAALIGSGASVWCITQEAAGLRPVPAEAARFGASRMLPLLGWGLLAGLIVLLGFVLLILPGVYLGTVLFAVTCVVLYERAGIDRCFTLVNPRFFATLGRLLLVVVAALVYQSAVAFVLSAAFGPTTESSLAGVLLQLLSIPISMFATAVVVVTYAELRHHEAPGSVTTPRLVSELSRR